MKKYIISSAFICAVFIFLCLTDSCKKTPLTACIGSIPSSASVGAPLTFTSCSSGASSYVWRFGDGDSATTATAVHAYASTGSYTGNLTVGSGSSSNTKIFTITITPNTWTFKGIVYTADSVVAQATSLVAYGRSSADTSILTFLFGSAVPSANGNDTVENANNGAGRNQVNVYIHVNGVTATYGSDGNGIVAAAMTVSGGKLSISLPPIQMINIVTSLDTSTLSAAISQTK